MVSRRLSKLGDMEGFGIVYLEANLLGKPVVAGRFGGAVDAVLHEKTGLLVDPENTRELSAAIIRLFRNPSLARRLGENGKARVLSQFSSAATAQKVLKCLYFVE